MYEEESEYEFEQRREWEIETQNRWEIEQSIIEESILGELRLEELFELECDNDE